jgi:hypothetical protein
MRSVSLEHLTMIDASPVELIDAAAAGGFDMVGLRVVPPQPPNILMPGFGDPRFVRDVKARSAGTGIAVGMIEAIWLAPETRPEEIERALAVGAELGAQYALVCGNDPDEARTIDNLGRLARDARGYGLEIAFEFMSFVAVGTLAQALRIARATGEPNVRLLVDALHLSRAGADLAAFPSLDSTVVSYCICATAPPHCRRPKRPCATRRGTAGSIPGKVNCRSVASSPRCPPMHVSESKRPAAAMHTWRRSNAAVPLDV